MVKMATADEPTNGQKAFWENMADHYPLPFDPKTLVDTNRVIDIAEEKGVIIDRATILDIGCGTGIYTLPMAQRADRVTGIDSSYKMLAILARERSAHHIGNTTIYQLNWQQADIQSLGLAKAFDIVWASMTPAIRDEKSLDKMRLCAKTWCVYVGWGNLRKNELLEEAFAAHGLSFGPPPVTIKTLLKKQGINPTSELVRTFWDWQGNIEEACVNVTGYLTVLNTIEVQPELIRKIVGHYTREGRVRHRTHVEMEVLVWSEL
jgi:SAM-dependent methyltransferase